MAMTGSGGDPVAAIREQDATGEIAALFDDIRRTLGVPVVNLVWRHLATIPGGLPWAWARVRPLYRSGVIAAEAQALHAALDLPGLPVWPAAALRAAGLAPADERGVRTVLDAYNRSNGMNLIALSALLLELDGAGATGAAPAPSPAPAAPQGGIGGGIEGGLPYLLPLSEMAPATAALVQALNLLGERADEPILASMYRHLAHWPPFLALAWTLIAPLHADGRLTAAIAGGLQHARARATALLGGLGAAPAELDATAGAPLRAALDAFTTHPIGKMVTICALLRRAMPARETDDRA
mgnify:CR=1 FL=1